MTSGAEAPVAQLSPAEVRRGLRLSTMEGAIATVHISITGAIGGSVFLTGFALLLGADNFQLGLLGALPFIGQVFQFIGAYLETRIGNRRALVLAGSLGGRLIWALLLCLPFTGLPPATQLTIFFVALGCSYGLNGIAGNAWLSWMSDLVPADRRGRYFGVRNTVVGVSTMLSTYVAGTVLDAYRAQGYEAAGYALIFGAAVVAAFGAAALIARQPEPPLAPQPFAGFGALIRGPLQSAPFRRFVFAASGWALVTGVAAPFFTAYGITTLQLSFATLALTAIVASAVGLFFTPPLGWLMDRYGYRLVLTICVIGTVPLPLGWVLSTPTNIIPLWITSVFSGVFWPGVAQGIGNLLMERAPADQRGAAMAAFSAFSGVGTLLAGLLGGLLASALAGTQVAIGPLSVGGLATLFVLTSLGRVVMVGVFWRSLR